MAKFSILPNDYNDKDIKELLGDSMVRNTVITSTVDKDSTNDKILDFIRIATNEIGLSCVCYDTSGDVIRSCSKSGIDITNVDTNSIDIYQFLTEIGTKINERVKMYRNVVPDNTSQYLVVITGVKERLSPGEYVRFKNLLIDYGKQSNLSKIWFLVDLFPDESIDYEWCSYNRIVLSKVNNNDCYVKISYA